MKRVYFVDFARSYAICLALLDHSLNDFDVWSDYGFNQFASIKIFTSSATPTFLFLFGMMLELVYVKRYNQGGINGIKPQLVKRSLQCYLGFLLTIVAGVIGQVIPLKRGIGAAIFAANAHYGNILKLYSVLILVAMLLVVWRSRKTVWFVVICALSYWILYPFVHNIKFEQGNINIFTSVFFGFGNKAGPSILNGLSIVALGMLSATFISHEKPKRFLKYNVYMLLAVISVIVIFLMFIPLDEVVHNYIKNVYRYANHPLYYLISTMMALLNVLVFSLIIPIGTQVREGSKKLLVFGRNSLSAFTLGNIILNLVYVQIKGKDWNWLGPISIVLLVFFVLFFYEKWESRTKVMKNG